MTNSAREPWDDLDDAEAAAMVPIEGLTKRDLSLATGLPLKVIDKAVREGLPSRSTGSKREGLRFDLPACIEWLCERRAGERGGDGDTMTDAKRRKAIAEAERIEQANRKAAGELVEVAEVRREIAEGMASLRAALLAIPVRMTDQPAELQAAVRVELVRAINSLSFEHGGDNAPS